MSENKGGKDLKKSNVLKKIFMLIALLLAIAGVGEAEAQETVDKHLMPLTTCFSYYEGEREDRLVEIWNIHYFDDSTGLCTSLDFYGRYVNEEEAKELFENFNSTEGLELRGNILIELGVTNYDAVIGKTREEIVADYRNVETMDGVVTPFDEIDGRPFTGHIKYEPGEREDGATEIWDVLYFDNVTGLCTSFDSYVKYATEEEAHEAYEYYSEKYKLDSINIVEFQGELFLELLGGKEEFEMFGLERFTVAATYGDIVQEILNGVVTPFDAVEETAQQEVGNSGSSVVESRTEKTSDAQGKSVMWMMLIFVFAIIVGGIICGKKEKAIREKYNGAIGVVGAYIFMLGVLLAVATIGDAVLSIVGIGNTEQLLSMLLYTVIFGLLAAGIFFFTYRKCPAEQQNVGALFGAMLVVGFGTTWKLSWWFVKLFMKLFFRVNLGGKSADITTYASTYCSYTDSSHWFDLVSTTGETAVLKDRDGGNYINVRKHGSDGLVCDDAGNLYSPM